MGGVVADEAEICGTAGIRQARQAGAQDAAIHARRGNPVGILARHVDPYLGQAGNRDQSDPGIRVGQHRCRQRRRFGSIGAQKGAQGIGADEAGRCAERQSVDMILLSLPETARQVRRLARKDDIAQVGKGAPA